MAEELKALDTQPDDLNLVLGIHVEAKKEEKNQLYKGVL